MILTKQKKPCLKASFSFRIYYVNTQRTARHLSTPPFGSVDGPRSTRTYLFSTCSRNTAEFHKGPLKPSVPSRLSHIPNVICVFLPAGRN